MRRLTFRHGLILAAALLSRPAGGDVFLPDDPVARDRDDLPVPVPSDQRVVDAHDLIASQFLERVVVEPMRALDINTLGEVPDSSWFTNRIGVLGMSAEELQHGEADAGEPAPGAWNVVAAKTTGRTLGFRIDDPREERYLLKFEAPGNPETASAADAISSRILHAAGYNVPANHVAWVRREDLHIARGTRIQAGPGKWLELNDARLDRMLREVGRQADGRFRVMASHLLPGNSIGPFRFRGTRGDDANDVLAHEHRRALRGLYVFASWINHPDVGAINTLDTYRGERDRGHVIHYLVDFDSTLGSSGSAPKRPEEGWEHYFEAGRFFGSLLTLGIWLPPETGMRVPRLIGVGRAFESDVFSPGEWKPYYPNPAFAHLDTEDAFWATRILLRFRDEDIRAIVATGRISDARSADYLARTLIARRDKIARHWLGRVSSLDGFRVEGEALRFHDLRQVAGLEAVPAPATAQVERFDNAGGERSPLGATTTVENGRLELPREVSGATEGEYFVVRLTTGARWVDVFLRRVPAGLAVVGIERERRPAFAAR